MYLPASDTSAKTWVVGGARFADLEWDAEFALHEPEHRRRNALGMSAVTDLAVLDEALHHQVHPSPTGADLFGSFPGDLCPAGLVVQATTTAVGRVAARRALTRAHIMSKLVPVTVRTNWPRRGLDELVLQADALGVGLLVEAGGYTEQLVEPAAPDRVVFDAAVWAFHERAYERWVSQTRRRR